ncbi:hypothetical protein OnM2_071034 [Erysiphe neolycopersici]|uniref:Uncharacterized protein n=1 Tax=Erysiphe neolycopersici TaxID=212602 RepID=A0A420HKF8_9PEZI|nr:hypothetical protein OnM2_071034 [Erysiphe neolycopersici]
MERSPVAQMSNGSPYVEPHVSDSNKPAIQMENEAVNAYTTDAVTMWVTTTLTSVQIQTSILTSLVVSLSTITQISTMIVNAPATSSISGTINPDPAASSQLSSNIAGIINPPLASSVMSNQTFTSTTDMNTPTSMTTSFFSGDSSATASQFISISPNPTNLIPIASESAELIHRVSNHDSLIRTMAVLVSAIFLTTAILAAGLHFLKRKEEKVSEIEAANTAQRQEQPLMNEPIVPYSSAYGSNVQD